VETNTRQVKVFEVPHLRHMCQGAKAPTDPRHLRACGQPGGPPAPGVHPRGRPR
jgi:hypothetical protein